MRFLGFAHFVMVIGFGVALIASLRLFKESASKPSGFALLTDKTFDIGPPPKRLSQAELERFSETVVLGERDKPVPHAVRRYQPDGTVWQYDFTNSCWRFIRFYQP